MDAANVCDPMLVSLGVYFARRFCVPGIDEFTVLMYGA